MSSANKAEKNDIKQFETLSKKVKLQVQSQQKEPIFLSKQQKQISQFLIQMKDYPKITALQISHQQKSLKTLNPQILSKFPQLSNRINGCIQCCQKNSIFLQKVSQTLKNYLKINNQQKPSSHQESLCSHQHSHNQSYSPNRIINLFYHLAREYSQQQIHKKQRQYVQVVKSTFKDMLEQGRPLKNNLVLGVGMGRTAVEINHLLNEYKQQGMVQGHQEDEQFYLFAEYMLNHSAKTSIQIYPYIHNFSNNLSSDTPYLPIHISPIISPKPFPLTYGAFLSLYKTHTSQWSSITTQFYNYHLTDILLYVQLIHKMLEENGVWIDICTACFQKHVTPFMSYKEYQNILQKAQFKCVNKFSRRQNWYNQQGKIMNQWRTVYYRIMTKI